jgi:hypothetical protein
MVLRRKELEYLKNEMTWREFADAAGAKVLVRGLARGSNKKIPTKIMKKVQLRIEQTMGEAGRKAMVQDALKEMSKALHKNGHSMTNGMLGKSAKKAKVSRRFQKQVEAAMSHRASKAA